MMDGSRQSLWHMILILHFWYEEISAVTPATTDGMTVTPLDLELVTLEENNTGEESTSPNTTTEPNQQTTAIYNPLDPMHCNYSFTGRSDDVFIIDRSASFSDVCC